MFEGVVNNLTIPHDILFRHGIKLELFEADGIPKVGEPGRKEVE
jgi:hypothetical protein